MQIWNILSKKMEEVGSYLNNKKAVAENISRVNEVWNSISGLPMDLSPDRRFVSEVEVSIGGKGDKERKLYLFNDTLIISKPKKGLFNSKEKIDVIFQLGHVSLNWSEGKQLTISYNESEALYTLHFPDPQMKKEWATLIEETVKKYKEKTSTIKFQDTSIDDNNTPPPIKGRGFHTLRKLSSIVLVQEDEKEDIEIDNNEIDKDENEEGGDSRPRTQRHNNELPKRVIRRSLSLPSITDIFNVDIQNVQIEDVNTYHINDNSTNEDSSVEV